MIRPAPEQEWWTTGALAASGLPGVPPTRQGVDALAARQDWRAHPTLARRREGRGGGWEYNWQLLPVAAQTVLLKQKAAAADADDQQVARMDRGTAWAWYEGLPEAVKAEARARLRVVQQVEVMAGTIGRNLAVAAVAEAERAQGRKGSVRTIWGWMGMVDGVDEAVGAAAAQARLLAASLGISLQQSLGLMRLGAGKGAAGAQPRVSWGAGSALSGLGSGTGLTFGDNPGSAPPVSLPSASVPTGGGSGGGAAAEADAVENLIAELERQNAALRVLNPLQQEIERNHEALAKATDKEREKVETLIAERMRLEEIRDRLDQIEQAGESAFKGLITGAYSFREALSMVLAKLIEMQASSIWDMIWGGTGGGGGLGGFLAGLLGLPAKAEGGKVEGPGGPREDNLLHWLSAGEYIVNAHATAANLPLLEAINAGVPLDRLVDMIGGQRLPALANGGLVGAAAPRAWGQRMEAAKAELARSTAAQAERPGMDVRLFMDRDGNWQAAVERISGNVAVEAMSSGLEIFSAQVLPDRMAEIQSQPRVRG